MTTAPRIETGRLVLRAGTRGDFDRYAEMLGSDRTIYMGGPYSRQAAWDMYCNITAQWQFSGFGGWLIEAGGTVIGEIAIWHPPHFPEPEIGWTLMPEAEGKGYAYDAARAALDWWWSATEAESIVSYIDYNNHRSIALAKRLGATEDATAPRAEGDTPDDTAVYRHRRPQ